MGWHTLKTYFLLDLVPFVALADLLYEQSSLWRIAAISGGFRIFPYLHLLLRVLRIEFLQFSVFASHRNSAHVTVGIRGILVRLLDRIAELCEYVLLVALEANCWQKFFYPCSFLDVENVHLIVLSIDWLGLLPL